MLYLTIDATAEESRGTEPVRYTGPPAGGAAWLAVPWLRMPAVRRVLGWAASVERRGFSVVVPFSTSLFIRDGVIPKKSRGEELLRRLGHSAFTRHAWLTEELALTRAQLHELATRFSVHHSN